MADEPLSAEELARLVVTADRWFNNDENLLLTRLIAELVDLRRRQMRQQPSEG